MYGVGMDELRVAATELMRTIVERCDKEPSPVKRAKSNAIYEVCRQWLAEHPEGDDEPVTMEWWKSVNNGTRFLCQGRYTLMLEDNLTFIMDADVGLEDCVVFAIPMPHVKTRGDVRRLCKALGVSLVG